MLHSLKYRIEQLIDEGYSLQPLTPEDLKRKEEFQLIHAILTERKKHPKLDYDPDMKNYCYVPQIPCDEKGVPDRRHLDLEKALQQFRKAQ